MDTVLVFFLFGAGLVLTIWGGDHFIDASVALANRLGIPKIVIGATIVSLGTTLPEITVSVLSAMQGNSDIALGNGLGSIICNTALIGGLTICLKPGKFSTASFAWRVSYFFGCMALTAALAFDGILSRLDGVLLAAVLVGYVVLSLRDKASQEPEEKGGEKLLKIILLLALGAVAIFLGARLMVDNGIRIARLIGISERVIGLTFIALGTSLPELVTALTALAKGHLEVSLGNIVGANLINLVAVIGFSAAIGTIPVSPTSLWLDIPFAAGVMLLLTLPVLLRKRSYRLQGAVLVSGYAAYMAYMFLF